MQRLLSRLRRNRDGSVAVEFALVGPILLGMLMGVLQIGIGMQNYNALRGISADTARYAVVNYQTANRLTTSQRADHARPVRDLGNSAELFATHFRRFIAITSYKLAIFPRH